MPKTGRISIKGKERTEKKFERQSYKFEYKQAILKYWEECKRIDLTLQKFWNLILLGCKCLDREIVA